MPCKALTQQETDWSMKATHIFTCAPRISWLVAHLRKYRVLQAKCLVTCDYVTLFRLMTSCRDLISQVQGFQTKQPLSKYLHISGILASSPYHFSPPVALVLFVQCSE